MLTKTRRMKADGARSLSTRFIRASNSNCNKQLPLRNSTKYRTIRWDLWDSRAPLGLHLEKIKINGRRVGRRQINKIWWALSDLATMNKCLKLIALDLALSCLLINRVVLEDLRLHNLGGLVLIISSHSCLHYPQWHLASFELIIAVYLMHLSNHNEAWYKSDRILCEIRVGGSGRVYSFDYGCAQRRATSNHPRT